MKSLRILVIEDDAIMASLLAELLVQMGHFVCAIEGTEDEAVAAAKHCRPELLIVDVFLRHGSGPGAVDTIGRDRRVPFLFVSCDITSVLLSRPGAVALQKPFREADLAAGIERAIAISAAA